MKYITHDEFCSRLESTYNYQFSLKQRERISMMLAMGVDDYLIIGWLAAILNRNPCDAMFMYSIEDLRKQVEDAP